MWQVEIHLRKKKKKKKSLLTDWVPPNWAGNLLPGIFGLLAVGWESFSEVYDSSSKLIRSAVGDNIKETDETTWQDGVNMRTTVCYIKKNKLENTQRSSEIYTLQASWWSAES